MDANKLRQRMLKDLRVELADEFNRNFQRKAFFSEKWKPRKPRKKARGSLLVVTGTMRRSIRSEVTESGVRFSSAVPYAAVHNEGAEGTRSIKAHTRKSKKGKTYAVKAHTQQFNLPQRQFIGDGKEVRAIVQQVVEDCVAEIDIELSKMLQPQ